MPYRLITSDVDIEATILSFLAPEAELKRAAAAFARQEIAKAQAHNSRVIGPPGAPQPKVSVNGVPGAALETVNPRGGSVVAEWDIVASGTVLHWIRGALRMRSPVGSRDLQGRLDPHPGRYLASHMLFVDGRAIADGEAIPETWAEAVFTNPQPYSRRLEVGKTRSGRAWPIYVENRMYENVAVDAINRFGKIVAIKHVYRSLVATGGKLNRQTRAPAILVQRD